MRSIESKFTKLNGVIIPGGGAVLQKGHFFYDTASKCVIRLWQSSTLCFSRMSYGLMHCLVSNEFVSTMVTTLIMSSPPHRVLDLARAANHRGDYFPVLGICLGFETILAEAAGTDDILTEFDAEDAPAPLVLTPAAASSKMINALPASVSHVTGVREIYRHGF